MATVGTRKLPFKPRMSRGARRAVIERVGGELFALRGYDGVSMDEVAAAADITKATLYDHFDSKRALYVHLLSVNASAMVQYMSDKVRTGTGDPAEQLRAAVDAFFRFVEERPFAWRMLFREPPTDPELEPGAREVHRRATANMVELLRRVEPSRRELSDRQLLLRAEALKAAQQGLAAWWYDHPDVPRRQLVDAVVALTGVHRSGA